MFVFAVLVNFMITTVCDFHLFSEKLAIFLKQHWKDLLFCITLIVEIAYISTIFKIF
jgi:hypothetical protein